MSPPRRTITLRLNYVHGTVRVETPETVDTLRVVPEMLRHWRFLGQGGPQAHRIVDGYAKVLAAELCAPEAGTDCVVVVE